MKFGPIKLGGGNKDKKNTKEKKGFLDGSTKKKKESRETVELKLQAELDMIAERYQNTIVSETAKIRERSAETAAMTREMLSGSVMHFTDFWSSRRPRRIWRRSAPRQISAIP